MPKKIKKKVKIVSNPYNETSQVDFISRIRPLLDAGSLVLNDDGTVKPTISLPHKHPWIHTNGGTDLTDCLWLKDTFYSCWGIIPIRCHKCYKVTVTPRTLAELMKLQEIQGEIGMWSKCGIDLRHYVPRLYSGFFYCIGLEEGLDRLDEVRKIVAERISPDVHVMLKRGCTEYLDKFPDTTKWKIYPLQEELEAAVEKYYIHATDRLYTKQPLNVVMNIQRRWVEYAFSNGDITYKMFTGGQPLSPDSHPYERKEKS